MKVAAWTALLFIALVILGILVLAMAAGGAEKAYCDAFAGRMIELHRDQVLEREELRYWSQCLNLDEPPTIGDAEEITALCKRDYRSYREADDTVIRYGSGGWRVPCPYRVTPR